MHFNIYLDDETGRSLNQLAELSGESRNALIRKAISEWIAKQARPAWPQTILDWRGIPDFPAFESSRSELKPASEDPFA